MNGLLIQPIWGWPSGWLGILEFAPLEVSGSILSGANFGGLSPYRACSGFKRGPRKWAVGLVPSD
ncbi:hypothetical protein MtrunA17_Chr4g0054181 [Medicago truncatula]|uniref:Uncharacterized protein n=1 Tax=Medicago truncatula TaxID=3880 RepID=A0A396IBS4_MEDTR|nr:hypothetical protein MtrunA17_Chr4g0054181 [Medicago truncatula]